MKRSTAAPPRMARSAMPAPPHRVSPQRSSVLRSGLDLWRGVADELGDVSLSDDDRIDSRPLELHYLRAARHGHVGDRELSGRNIGQQLQRAGEWVGVFVRGRGEQEDLRVQPLQGKLELLLVPDPHHAVEPKLDRLGM